MLRRGVRKALPRRDGWHSLGQYAVGDANQQQFQKLRGRDTTVSGAIASHTGDKKIDWDAWKAKISNKEVLNCLHDFHAQQTELLDKVLAQDHVAAVKTQTKGWDLFEAAVESCKTSVVRSEEIVKNGAKALWISFQNPSISQVSQSEWLDTDQYWQAFVEKHQYYHNHLCWVIEDPESKEYDQKQEADLKERWSKFDGKGVSRQNNKLLYQRPSHEYYDYLRGPLIEHMIFYLTKTGGDARFFPENMPVEWFAQIYDTRFNLYNALQRRREKVHKESMSRAVTLDFHPDDMEHDGESYYMDLIATENAVTELTVARLMGNYILFSEEYVPVQSASAFHRALQLDNGQGTFCSLGDDVHCLFYKVSGDALALPDPMESFRSLVDHVTLTGRRFKVGYAVVLEEFCKVLESRKPGLSGVWFTAPEESSRDAFMRRLKADDPAHAVYEAYANEHAERWAAAESLTVDEALKKMPEIERLYRLECSEYDNVLYAMSEQFSGESKVAQDMLLELNKTGELQSQLNSGHLVAIEGSAQVKDAEAVLESVEEFEKTSEKAVNTIMSQKTTLG